ncbi:hypothetical protein VDG1235_781 [Verrucomicrobiia bacterium DG1235]|nr:hypothetical protein VDG1235_781 [Verrucomicrobiae bacterium DG1235]
MKDPKSSPSNQPQSTSDTSPKKAWETPTCSDIDDLKIEGGPAVFITESPTAHVS